MKFFSAQYIFTNTSSPVKRGIIVTEDDGTIINVEDNSGIIREKHSVEFHNGIIIPGFVNCHCHLELSYLKNVIPSGNGLPDFLANISLSRNSVNSDKSKAIREADKELLNEGVVLCADICNDESTFSRKKESNIKYISLLEVFGIDSSRAEKRMNEITDVGNKAGEMELPYFIVPHSVYSVSLELLRLIKKQSESNRISSVHFLESAGEEQLLKSQSGPLMDAYRKFLLPFSDLNIPEDHVSAVLNEITTSGNLLLVHNTFIKKEHINGLKNRKGIFWCLCPNSNLYIENRVPPADLLDEERCNIVIGTDSLASNKSLSMIGEMKTLQDHFPEVPLGKLIRWATLNGAIALGEENSFGSIEPGKKPGLVLIKDADLVNLRILPPTTVKRLI